MTITLGPDQGQAIRDAIRGGHATSVEELIERAIAGLPKGGEAPAVSSFAGLSMFGSPEDAALLEEVISIAYEERRRPSKREAAV